MQGPIKARPAGGDSAAFKVIGFFVNFTQRHEHKELSVKD